MTEPYFPPPPPEGAKAKRRFSPLLLVMTLVLVAGTGAAGYGLFNLLGYTMLNVTGRGMSPTLNPGDVVLVHRVGERDIPRGAVVLVDLSAYPDSAPGEGQAIQRVIGIAGDEVVCCTNDNLITVNGKPIKEPYAELDNGYGRDEHWPFSVKVPPGSVYLAGDQRNDSRDSRVYADQPGNGAVPLSDVHGILVGLGPKLAARPFPQTTAFVEAGLPGDPVAETGFRDARNIMLGGALLFIVGFIGVIVTFVRSSGKRRKAAAIPPVR